MDIVLYLLSYPRCKYNQIFSFYLQFYSAVGQQSIDLVRARAGLWPPYCQLDQFLSLHVFVWFLAKTRNNSQNTCCWPGSDSSRADENEVKQSGDDLWNNNGSIRCRTRPIEHCVSHSYITHADRETSLVLELYLFSPINNERAQFLHSRFRGEQPNLTLCRDASSLVFAIARTLLSTSSVNGASLYERSGVQVIQRLSHEASNQIAFSRFVHSHDSWKGSISMKNYIFSAD